MVLQTGFFFKVNEINLFQLLIKDFFYNAINANSDVQYKLGGFPMILIKVLPLCTRLLQTYKHVLKNFS